MPSSNPGLEGVFWEKGCLRALKIKDRQLNHHYKVTPFSLLETVFYSEFILFCAHLTDQCSLEIFKQLPWQFYKQFSLTILKNSLLGHLLEIKSSHLFYTSIQSFTPSFLFIILRRSIPLHRPESIDIEWYYWPVIVNSCCFNVIVMVLIYTTQAVALLEGVALLE